MPKPEDFGEEPESASKDSRINQDLRNEAMTDVADAWAKLIRANDTEGADEIERVAKKMFVHQHFQEKMAEAVQST